MSKFDNARIVLAKYTRPDEPPRVDHFRHEKCPSPLESHGQLSEGEVIIKTLYLSVDPTIRFCMNAAPYPCPEYEERWKEGEVVSGVAGLGKIVLSQSEKFKPGDYVVQLMKWPWQLFFTESDKGLRKLDLSLTKGEDNMSLYLSCFTVPGLTSLLGLWVKGHLNEGVKAQTWVVSGAAGSCGALAGQLVKLESESKDVRVIGICGSEEKCQFIREIGFDGAINYKTDDVGLKLDQLCPDGIDRYFDNVGGKITDEVMARMTQDSHVVLCGQISGYSQGGDVPYPFPCSPAVEKVIKERNVTRDRFLVVSYPELFEKATAKLAEYYLSGRLKVRECFEDGLENAPLAFIKVMTGGNIGRQLVRVSKQ
ncbi:Prostaglandin reductase 2 [Chamberlinius hualienensis]